MKKTFFKLKTLLPLFLLGVLSIGFGPLNNSKAIETKVSAAFDSTLTRISVVRPSFWEDAGALQLLVIGDQGDFNASGKQIRNADGNMDGWFQTSRSNAHIPSGYAGDTYYTSGGFSEYVTSGLLFYDVKITELTGKWFSFVRTPGGEDDWRAIWNMTTPIQYNADNGNSLHRIWGNGEGTVNVGKSEAQNVSDAAIAGLMYGYMSCLDDDHSGFRAFTKLDSVYDLEKRLGSTESVTDFGDEAHYITGKTGENQVSTPLGAKLTMMKNLNTTSQSANPSFADNNSLTATIIIGLIGISTLAGYYFITKKSKVVA